MDGEDSLSDAGLLLGPLLDDMSPTKRLVSILDHKVGDG